MKKISSLFLALAMVFGITSYTPVWAASLSATSDTLAVEVNTPANGDLNYTEDKEGDTVTFAIVGNPEHGAISELSATEGTYLYTPDLDYEGEDSFTFTVVDTVNPDLDPTPGTISITVAAAAAEPSPEVSPEPSPEPSPVPSPSVAPDLFPYYDADGTWYEEAADYVADKEVFRGPQYGARFFFEPETLVTRIDYIMLLNKAFGVNVAEYTGEENPFSDQGLPQYVLDEAKAAYYNGITNGNDENGKIYLMPFEVLTRAEAAVFLDNAIAKFATPPTTEEPLEFRDANSIPSWAYNQISRLTGAQVINGYDDNTYRPSTQLNRSSAIQLVYNAMIYAAEHPIVAASPITSPEASPMASADAPLPDDPSANSSGVLSDLLNLELK
ncbi:MAG: S-layer homology domain-containing protein [Clostridiales bacterium]|nr:S-layer homology domain-containing protein [Clostridiales bacterium]